MLLRGWAVTAALSLTLCACALLPNTAPIPTAGRWALAYEMSPADSAAIGSKVTKSFRMPAWSTTSTYELLFDDDGKLMGSVKRSGADYTIDLDDCLSNNFLTCNSLKLHATAADRMEGTMNYYDEAKSLKIGPVTVTATQRDFSTPPPSPAPSR